MEVAVVRSARSRAWICAAVILLGAMLFVALPIWQLIVPGPFDWHMQLPRFWQGGLEALLLAALIAGGFVLNRRGWLIALVAIPTALYLRRHAVDVPLLIDLLYFEIVIGVGMAMRRALGLPAARGGEDYLHAFVLGFLVWSLAAWSLSAFGLGSIKQLRWLTLLLVAPACYGRTAPLALYAWSRMRLQGPAARAWCGLLAAWLLILFARSNVVVGYDPLWYGLRAEYVLDPGHSLFEPLGLVAPVYYFPKLYEAFLLPLSALRDFSVIDGMTILLLIPILLACRLLMQRLVVPARAQWPLLAAIATLPALANTAIGPKPDVIATLFVLLAALAALDAARERSHAAAAWMLACMGLACLAKLAAIPYVAALALATAISAWRVRSSPAGVDETLYPRRLAATAIVATLVLAGFVTARTWLLTGMPTIGPDPLVAIWNALGMSLHEPAGTGRWSFPPNWPALPGVVFDVLLRPYHDLPHMVVTWIGNVWLWLALIAGAAACVLRVPRPTVSASLPLLALVAAGLYLFFAVGYSTRGSDGNYFLFAVVPAIVISAAAAFARLDEYPRLFALTLACLSAFVAFHASYSFISAGWNPGTLAFDTNLGRGWHDTRKLRQRSLEEIGLARIAAYLKEQPGASRVVGYTVSSSGHWLPVRYESIDQISYARPDYVESAGAFRRFLEMQRIGYLILPLPATAKGEVDTETVPDSITEAAAELAALPGTRRIDDRRHYLLDFSAVAASDLDRLPQSPAVRSH